jgi:hypothetical protein
MSIADTRLADLRSLTQPFLIVCEGPSDVALIRELIVVRSIGGFHVVCPTKPDVVGKTGFKVVLENMGNFMGNGLENVRAVIVIGDKDADPDASFLALKDQIDRAGHLEVPDAPDVIVGPKEIGYPKTVVHMIPDSKKTGQLEDDCLPAAYAERGDLKVPLDTYCGSVTAGWTENRESKMRLRVLMASHYVKPTTDFYDLWIANPGPLLPLTDLAFQPLADFLASVVANA